MFDNDEAKEILSQLGIKFLLLVNPAISNFIRIINVLEYRK